MENKHVFDELVATSASELFRSLGVDIARCEDAPSLDCIAVIGFTGKGIRGALGVGMASSLRNALAPSGGDNEDWHAEVANQLLGRLKVKMLRYGTPVDMALPMVLRGVRLEFAERTDDLLTFPFEHPSGTCAAWLDVKLDPGVTLAISDDPDARSIPNEGDTILF